MRQDQGIPLNNSVAALPDLDVSYWREVADLESIPSPGLLVDRDRISRNIGKMIEFVGAGHTQRLRPHVKTHKMPEVVRMQLRAGIEKFKAATLAEAEMAAAAGADDVLLAYQPVGPNLQRLAKAVATYPETSFAVIADDPAAVRRIAEQIGDAAQPLRVLIDIDCGMHRTGVEFGPRFDELRDAIDSLQGVSLAGLHVYDGHLHDSSLQQRSRQVAEIVDHVRRQLARHSDASRWMVVGGGSPTFALWAQQTDWECSPGTSLLWDVGYARSFGDLEFEVAAALLARVISKPGRNSLCLDLGHKAVAAENPIDRRVWFPALPDARLRVQSEEHLVLETEQAGEFAVGDMLCALPQHICPTVALHHTAYLVRNGRATGETWQVTARDR